MARGPAARRRDRGGEVIQALRPARARVVAAFAAVVAGGGLAVYPLLRAGSLVPLAGVIGVLAVAMLMPALLGFEGALPWAIVLFGLSYTIVDVARGEPLAAAPLYGAGLLLAAELVYAARELASSVDEHARRRVPWLAGVAFAAVVAASVPVAAAGISNFGGLGGAIVAAALSASLLVGPVLLLRRR